MPTLTCDNNAFIWLNFGLACIRLDLSSGDNHFDLSRLDDPNDACNQTIPANIRAKIHSKLDHVTVHIGEFGVPGGTVRLNHLGVQSMHMGWSSAHGGSVVMTVRFESAGKELLGAFQGDINNAVLRIYFPIGLDCTGKLTASIAATFDASISVVGLPDFLVPKTQIRHAVVEGVQDNLRSSAVDLAQLALTSLFQPGSPTPSDDAIYTQLIVADGTATIAWADTVRYAKVTVESVQPDFADPEERLILRLGASWHGNANCVASRTAEPDSVLALPLSISIVPLPDGKPLDVGIALDSIDLTGSAPKGRTVGTVRRTFTAPAYGAGAHTDHSGQLAVSFKIEVS
jgi:hypothetical protein